MLTSLVLALTVALTSQFLCIHGSLSNLVSPSVTGALSALKYTHVGGSGSYQQVTNMVAGKWPSCTANPSCVKSTKTVSGPLAPFDEDLTFNFRGSMNLYNIAVYQPGNPNGATWKKVSSWAANGKGDNLVFMNNQGGGASGEWTSKFYPHRYGCGTNRASLP